MKAARRDPMRGKGNLQNRPAVTTDAGEPGNQEEKPKRAENKVGAVKEREYPMMSRLLAFVAAALCLTAPAVTVPTCAAPAAGPARLVDEVGGFSYVPPAGWRVAAVPGLKYKIAYGKPAQGFAPNINVVDETAAVSIADYARRNVKNMQQLVSGFHEISLSPFVTNSGLRGFRLRGEAAPAGRKLRQTNYLFAGSGDRKIVVTASTLASDGSKHDAMLDAVMKTFTLK